MGAGLGPPCFSRMLQVVIPGAGGRGWRELTPERLCCLLGTARALSLLCQPQRISLCLAEYRVLGSLLP